MKCKKEGCNNTNIKAKGFCKKCYQKAYREVNERLLAQKKEYYETNKDKDKIL